MWRATLRGLLLLTLAFGVTFAKPAFQTSKEVKIPRCSGGSKLVARCFTVRGRMVYANGSYNVRIFPRDGGTTLAVANVPGSFTDEHPDGIFRMPTELFETSAPGVDIFGDFDVCPLSRERPGAMQFVCVESAKQLIVKDYNKEPVRVYKIHDTTNH